MCFIFCSDFCGLINFTFCILFVTAGIMAILFCGIVMSHYTHFNLSPMTQITVQQIFRTMAFMAGKTIFISGKL